MSGVCERNTPSRRAFDEGGTGNSRGAGDLPARRTVYDIGTHEVAERGKR